MKKVAVFLLLLAAPLTARAGVDRWTPFGPGGGYILDLGLAPTLQGGSALYARAEHGIFRSLDGGESWTWQSNPFYGPLAVDPEEPDLLYTVDNYIDQVFRSGNGGIAWTPLPGSPGGEVPTDLTLLKAAGGVLYGGGDRGIFASLDGGGTWIHASLEGGAVSSIAVLASQPLVAYAATPSGVWKTSDGGLHWSRVFPASRPGFLAVAPGRPDRVYFATGGDVYRTEDGGAVWTRVSGLADVSGLTVDAAGTVYASVLDGVQVSADLGVTWRRTFAVARIFEVSEMLGLVADPDRPGLVYAATLNHGLFVSRDGGLSWSAATRKGLGFPVTKELKIDPRSGAAYLVRLTWTDGLLRSTDGGLTWTALAEVPGINDVAFDPRDPDILYAVGDGLFRTEDGGLTWTPLPTPVGAPSLYRIVARGRTLVAGSYLGVHRSTDRGSTWEHTLVGDVARLVEDPMDPSTLYALSFETQGTAVYRSRDGGASWRRILADAQAFAPDPLRRGRLYAAQGRTILFSRDRGTTWQPVGQAPAPVRTLAVDSFRPGILLAGTRSLSGVILSRNGGRTWTPYNVGLARMRVSWSEELVADPLVPGRFFTLPDGGGAFEVTIP